MKIYTSPFLSRALSTAILACCFATASLNAQVPVISGSFAEAYVVNVEIPTYTITASNTPTSYGATSLPPGLLRVGATIVGTPSQAGVFNVTLFALNADGFDQRTLELTVSGAEIESSLSETATVGEPYTYQITANNGPTVFNEIGLVDFPGLSLDTATGLISGTPTEVRTSDIFIQAINGASVATALLVLDVSGVPPAEPTVTIDSPLNGADYTDGDPITLEITADDADGFLTQVKVFSGTIFLGIAQFIGVDQYSFQSNTGTAGLEVGTQNLTVQATDNVGNVVTSDSVVVDVLPKATGAAPDVSITSPTAGNSIKSGETLEITVDASDADTDGFITSVEVFNNAVSLGLANPTGAAGKYLLSYRTSAADLGNLNLQARAVDNQGNVGYSAILVYSVVQGAVPTVRIDDPADGEVFFINTPIPVSFTGTDADDSIVSVEVFSNGSSVGFASLTAGATNPTTDLYTGTYEFVLTETAEAGLQRLTAVATDELGNRTTSSEVNVLLSSGAAPVTVLNTVNGSAPAVAPLVDEVDLGSVVTLDISASDSDGNVTQVEVFNGATSIGLAALVGVDTYRFDYQASSPGLLNLQVRSSDDLGNIGFSDLVPVSIVTGDTPTVSIDSPADGDSYTLGDLIALEITADDADGFVTQVEIFNNTTSLGFALWIGGDQYRYSIDTALAGIASSTLNLSARVTDNSGNAAYALLSVDLLQLVFSVGFTDPTTDPFTLVSESFEVGTHTFEVEVVGIDPTTLQSIEWYLDGVELVSSPIVSGSLIYSQSITLKENGVVTAVATNSTGVPVEASVTVALSLANPLSDNDDFVYYLYQQFFGEAPTATQLDAALALLDDTHGSRVAFLETLLDSNLFNETRTVMMVYRTMTGEWPDTAELAIARAGLFGGTVGSSSQTGNIDAGGTQTFEIFFTAGDDVTVRAAADGSNGDPLSDATLTINDPSGNFVAYSDDSIFNLDPLINFTPSQTGAYTVVVGGWSPFQSGDFSLTTVASNSGSGSSASAQALVTSLIPEFEDRFDMTFPTSSVAASSAEATSLAVQLFKNKHGVNPSPQATVRLKASLTGSNSGSWPGYSGNLTVFTSAFALDNSRSSFNQAYSSVHYYEIPNQPISDVPLALMIAMFLGEDPSDQALAAYGGMTQAQAFEDILTDPRYYEQFTPTSVESFVNLTLAALGIFDQSLNGPADDADGDGVSNLMEIALGSDPTDLSDSIEPMASEIDGTDFVITFIRIIASEVPGDFIISLECSEDMIVWDTAMDTAALASSVGVLQDDVPEGYERVEIRIDMTAQNCGFFRLSVNLP